MNNYEKTLKKIESLERKWYYDLSTTEDKQHSFGRIPEDGKRVGFWSIPRTTGEYLQFMVGLTNAKNILELGCSAGYSTLFLAKKVAENKGHVYTTEILKEKIKIAKQNFKEAELEENITLIEENILSVLKNWKKPILDFVFIDADKEKYSEYLDLLLPLLKKGGLIIADNANNAIMQDGTVVKCNLMKPFLEKIKKDNRVISYVLNIDNGLALVYKK